jgi:isoleucyl-tRNA synthetase
MFEPVSNKVRFPEMESGILKGWQEQDVFGQSLRLRRGGQEFVFYDGPPFATGLPHYGHLLPGTIKDIVPRYQTMRGHYVERRFGWDCHGLPIEALAQDELGLAGAAAIKELGVDVFNEKCRSMVLAYVAEWEKTVNRLGRWVDFKNDYKTMDPTFMESVWWVFKQLWDQGRIYKAFRVMPYSWKLTTPLSNLEASNNYKDIQDPAVTVRFRLRAHGLGADPAYALAWTTTPWTLPGNLALCAGPDIDYVAVQDDTGIYLLAEARVAEVFPKPGDVRVLKRCQGRELKDWTYEPLFPYFAGHPNAFRLLVDEFVSTGEGTGIVHMAPAYGEDDYRICRREQIDLVDYLDEECRFTDALPEYRGQFCKDADKALIRRLKEEGSLVHQSTLQHTYPFCERTDTPLIFRAIEAWYVRVEDLRDDLVANNRQTHWSPAFVGDKRFGNWLKDARDWNISRNRFWGSCLPVWVSEDKKDMICVGSLRELEELSGEKITDLHKHVVDRVVIRRDGKTYRRTPEVLDCWFESGSMPYAQPHYPFENQAWFESHFPADFIAESLDQTRGWFYYLLVLSTALFKRPAFKNVVVSGMVLAEDGRKMSKRLKNYPDPTYILDEYGADALRLYLMNSPLVRADDLNFSEEGVKHSLRHLLIPWWNAYSFFVTYARVDGWRPENGGQRSEIRGQKPDHLLDRWILSALERLKIEVVEAMDEYDLQRAVRPFVQFVEDLTNWYIRRSRRRFWKSDNDEDKQQAYATLYEVLLTLSKVAAPFVPFISEAIYRNLRTGEMPESVHLCDYPVGDKRLRNLELEEQMEAALRVVVMGRTLRAEYDLKVRQPLAGLHVVCRETARLKHLEPLQNLMAEELNVRRVWFSGDEAGLADLRAKANFRRLGPRLGGAVKQVVAQIERLDAAALESLAGGRAVAVEVNGVSHTIEPEDVILHRQPKAGLAVKSEGPLLVALETDLSQELVREGFARELVNKIQTMRKAADLEVTRRIRIDLSGDELLKEAVAEHLDYIRAETLAHAIAFVDHAPDQASAWDVNGHACHVRIEPV